MLTGRSPFHSPSRDSSAAAIMKRITAGDFALNTSQWDVVSEDAKEIVRGLLTIDPHARLTMSELRAHPWLHHPNKKNLRTPLATPEVLHNDQRQLAAHQMLLTAHKVPSASSDPKSIHDMTNSTVSTVVSTSTETGFRATFDAFHLATRGGFRLAEVGSASLAQRRLQKKSTGSRSTSTSTSSSSCVSGSASSCPSNGSPLTHHVSSSSSGMMPSSSSASSAPSVFTFPETKVAAYLQTLNTAESTSPESPAEVSTALTIATQLPQPRHKFNNNNNDNCSTGQTSKISRNGPSRKLIKAEFTVIQTEPLKFKFELLNNNNNNNSSSNSNNNGSSEPLEGLAVAATSTKVLSLNCEHKMMTRRRKQKAEEELYQAKRVKV